MKSLLSLITVALLALSQPLQAASPLTQRFIQIDASNRKTRTLAASLGMNLEAIRSDSVWGFADAETIRDLRAHGFKILGNFDYRIGRGGTKRFAGFPPNDARFHDYKGMIAELMRLQKENPGLAKIHVLGKSLEGRDILALQINSTPNSLHRAISGKPGAIYMGGHHAREHLSVEIPLKLADYLLKNKNDPKISTLLQTRDIWIIPLVNPDGSEYDISGDKYKFWRKNRRDNGDGTFGVDLNRNYGFLWGKGGGSTKTNAETYQGPKPFSEPETRTIKEFIDSHPNARTLISYHTFGEDMFYPWSGSFEPIAIKKDLAVFEKMSKVMAKWNGYDFKQSSADYISAGDTCDYAYGEHGIFAFTFELSPKEITTGDNGGFYPGDRFIDPTFNANIRPALYLLDLADNPYRAVTGTSSARPLGRTAENRFDLHPF